MASDKPHELIRTALTRAFFCEALAKVLPVTVSASAKSSDLFLMGLLSVTDAILDRPMEQILASLPIAPEVRVALCGGANSYRDVYDLLLAFERADWPALSTGSIHLGIDESAVADCEAKAREAASIC
jgi:c-di-GMP-related signal transduction protein